VRARLSPASKNILRDLALEFDRYLSQSEASSLEPWQQEICDYLRFGRVPILFARDNLAAWGRRRGLMTQAPARLSLAAIKATQHSTKSRSKPSETGLRNP
jgi:hypothetical protein